MARINENNVREIEGALEFVVPMHSQHRMLVRVVKAHFPNAPSGMRWCVASSVRTRDQGQSRTTLAGYPEKLRSDAREDEISANSVPCVLDMALTTPWYNAIILECESPGRGWFVDLAFDPYEPRATKVSAAPTAQPVPPAAMAPTATTATAAVVAPVSVVVSVAQGASRTFPCPYCAAPYAYASQAGRPVSAATSQTAIKLLRPLGHRSTARKRKRKSKRKRKRKKEKRKKKNKK
jgi:hypothetical protein